MEHPWEDSLVERKVESDLKDLSKTLVAFANSVRPGHVATILLGERNDGDVAGLSNPDQIQQTVRKAAERVYPPIVWRSSVYERDGKFCVRVEIEHSGDTPHFGGPAWVRKGSSTVVASDEMFQRLIDIRSSVVREFAKWLDKEVTVKGEHSSAPQVPESKDIARFTMFHRWGLDETAKLTFVNNFWITLQKGTGEQVSEPFEKLTLSFDDQHQRLKILVRY